MELAGLGPNEAQAVIESPDNELAHRVILCIKRLGRSLIEALPTTKIIKLGTYKTVEDLSGAIKTAGYNIDDTASSLLKNKDFILKRKELSIDLVFVSAQDLGFSRGATRKDVFEAALKQGLLFCPIEVGPQLRLQYHDQPLNEYLFIAMRPVFLREEGLEEGLSVFKVSHNAGGFYLTGDNAEDFHKYRRWVFARPSQSKL